MIIGKIKINYLNDNETIEFSVTDSLSEKNINAKILPYFQEEGKSKIIIQEAIECLSKGETEFSWHGENCVILDVTNKEKILEIAGYNKKTIIYNQLDPMPVIYLYRNQHICPRCKRIKADYHFEEVIALVISAKTDLEYPINVTHCKTCDTYYINDKDLKTYELKYGTLLLERSYDYIEDIGNSSTIHYKIDSILSRYGYKADGTQDDKERHKIIDWIIAQDENNGYEILQHLDYLINTRSNCYNAQFIWNDDYDYVKKKISIPWKSVGKAELQQKNKWKHKF